MVVGQELLDERDLVVAAAESGDFGRDVHLAGTDAAFLLAKLERVVEVAFFAVVGPAVEREAVVVASPVAVASASGRSA